LKCRPFSKIRANSSIFGGIAQNGLFAAARELAVLFQWAKAECVSARSVNMRARRAAHAAVLSGREPQRTHSL
jgi:hypothetical protein